MERKQKYNAPALLGEVKIEMEGTVLYASKKVEDTDYKEVETMGQVVVDEGISLEHKWE